MTFARQRAFIKEEITSRPSPTLTEIPLTRHSSCLTQRVVLRNDQSGINNGSIKKSLHMETKSMSLATFLHYLMQVFVFYGLDFVCLHVEFSRPTWCRKKKKIMLRLHLQILCLWYESWWVGMIIFTSVNIFAEKKIKMMWHFLCFCTNFLAASYMLNTKWDYRCSFILSVIIGALVPSLSFRQLMSRGLQTHRVALHVL